MTLNPRVMLVVGEGRQTGVMVSGTEIMNFVRHMSLKVLRTTPLRGSISGYVLAVAAVVLALLARLVLDPLSSNVGPYTTFYLATIVTASIAGPRPAIIAALLGGIAGDYFFILPFHRSGFWWSVNILWVSLYLLVSSTLIAAIEAQRRYRARAEDAVRELEHERRALDESHQRELERATELQAISADL